MAIKKYKNEVTNKIVTAIQHELILQGGFDIETVEYVINHYDFETMWVNDIVANISREIKRIHGGRGF